MYKNQKISQKNANDSELIHFSNNEANEPIEQKDTGTIMKNFFVDVVTSLIGALFFWPIVELFLFIIHRENDVSSMSKFIFAAIASWVWMSYDQQRKSN